jgi:hypothetical protein
VQKGEKALAAPVQEPAATLAVRWHEPVGKVAYVLEVNLPLGIHKVYTTPPEAQRQWVGLTDEERNTITRHHAYVDNIIRATEAKLKEKNT